MLFTTGRPLNKRSTIGGNKSSFDKDKKKATSQGLPRVWWPSPIDDKRRRRWCWWWGLIFNWGQSINFWARDYYKYDFTLAPTLGDWEIEICRCQNFVQSLISTFGDTLLTTEQPSSYIDTLQLSHILTKTFACSLEFNSARWQRDVRTVEI